MFTVHQVSKSFGITPVLENVSFSLNGGERLGLVGVNGCGKTTLLRIMAGQETPDSGSVQRTPVDLRVGYLPQGFEFPEGETVGGFSDRMQGGLLRLSGELERLAVELAAQPDSSPLQQAYDSVLAQISLAAESGWRGPGILASLGLGEMDTTMPVAHLSGGQKTRLALAGVLLNNPQVLLLDEPTNHLDLDMLTWLEDWLLDFKGGVLIVSHDRAFLDRVATGILDLDEDTHRLTAYAGNYSDYLEQKVGEQEKQWQEFKDQQDEIVQLKGAAAAVRQLTKMRKGGKADSGDKFARGFFANRSLATMRRAKHLEKRLEQLTGEDAIDKPRAGWQMKLVFVDTPDSGRDVLRLEGLSVGYDGTPLLRKIDLAVHLGQRIVLAGPNGTGKTTLLRTIAGRIPPLAGTVRLGAGVQLGYMTQEQEDLTSEWTPLRTIQEITRGGETDARTFLHQFLFGGDDVFVPVGALSYGERARLSLARLVALRCNFLLLDEPVNHLDIPSRTRFEQALAAFDGTVLAVVHDRYFIEGFASEVWRVEGDKVKRGWM